MMVANFFTTRYNSSFDYADNHLGTAGNVDVVQYELSFALSTMIPQLVRFLTKVVPYQPLVTLSGDLNKESGEIELNASSDVPVRQSSSR